jgi:CRP/FNR family transcriptional regulator, cyclic AMP receptor protein
MQMISGLTGRPAIGHRGQVIFQPVRSFEFFVLAEPERPAVEGSVAEASSAGSARRHLPSTAPTIEHVPRPSHAANGRHVLPVRARWVDDRPTERALLLEEDPDLGAGLSPRELNAASRLLVAPVMSVTAPRWEPPELEATTTFGLLVLDGLLGRRVRIGKGVNTELLSDGDILRPWDGATMWHMAPPELGWRVFRPARLAILDESITRIIGRSPQLVVTFSGRLLRRQRHTAYLAAIGHLTRVEERLLLTLWHVASCWGRVSHDGVVVPYRLTHEVLGEIIGARRPSVTIGISNLQARGRIVRRRDGCYVLIGSPEDAIPRGPSR